MLDARQHQEARKTQHSVMSGAKHSFAWNGGPIDVVWKFLLTREFQAGAQLAAGIALLLSTCSGSQLARVYDANGFRCTMYVNTGDGVCKKM